MTTQVSWDASVDKTAPHDDVHEHPDFDFHVTREGGKVRAVIWLYGTRHEMAEVDS